MPRGTQGGSIFRRDKNGKIIGENHLHTKLTDLYARALVVQAHRRAESPSRLALKQMRRLQAARAASKRKSRANWA